MIRLIGEAMDILSVKFSGMFGGGLTWGDHEHFGLRDGVPYIQFSSWLVRLTNKRLVSR